MSAGPEANGQNNQKRRRRRAPPPTEPRADSAKADGTRADGTGHTGQVHSAHSRGGVEDRAGDCAQAESNDDESRRKSSAGTPSRTPRKCQSAVARQADAVLSGRAVDGGAATAGDTVYLQTQQGGFKPVGRDEIQLRLDALKQHQMAISAAAAGDTVATAPLWRIDGAGKSSTLASAIGCHSMFHTVALMLQGLLCGACVVHCLFIWLLLPLDEDIESSVLLAYAQLALPINSLYTGLLLVTIVGALDRTDPLHGALRWAKSAATLRSAGLAAALGAVALAANCLMLPVEHKLALWRHDTAAAGHIDGAGPQWPPLADAHFRMTVDAPAGAAVGGALFGPSDWLLYKVCAVVRAAGVTAAWLLVALGPADDALTDNMHRLQQSFESEAWQSAADAGGGAGGADNSIVAKGEQ